MYQDSGIAFYGNLCAHAYQTKPPRVVECHLSPQCYHFSEVPTSVGRRWYLSMKRSPSVFCPPLMWFWCVGVQSNPPWVLCRVDQRSVSKTVLSLQRIQLLRTSQLHFEKEPPPANNYEFQFKAIVISDTWIESKVLGQGESINLETSCTVFPHLMVVKVS